MLRCFSVDKTPTGFFVLGTIVQKFCARFRSRIHGFQGFFRTSATQSLSASVGGLLIGSSHTRYPDACPAVEAKYRRPRSIRPRNGNSTFVTPILSRLDARIGVSVCLLSASPSCDCFLRRILESCIYFCVYFPGAGCLTVVG